MSYSRRPALRAASRNSTLLETIFLVGLVVVIATVFWTYRLIEGSQGDSSLQSPQEPQSLQNPKSVALRGGVSDVSVNAKKNSNNNQHQMGGFSRFTRIAQDLASFPPEKTLKELELRDPFGTRTFDSQLLEQETSLGRALTLSEIRQLFPCPSIDQRITLPDVRVEQKARDFREGKKGTFLFFQHLRKAGGTNFCSLAETNLPKEARPRY